MAWNSPRTWVANELVTATIMNTHVRDNLTYLLSGQPNDVATITAEKSTTSTNYVDVDGTNLTVSITCTSGRILVLTTVLVTVDNTGSNTADVQLFGDNSAGASTASGRVTQNTTKAITLMHPYTGLTPGTTYTFSTQYKASTGTIYVNNAAQGYNAVLMAMEI